MYQLCDSPMKHHKTLKEQVSRDKPTPLAPRWSLLSLRHAEQYFWTKTGALHRSSWERRQGPWKEINPKCAELWVRSSVGAFDVIKREQTQGGRLTLHSTPTPQPARGVVRTQRKQNNPLRKDNSGSHRWNMKNLTLWKQSRWCLFGAWRKENGGDGVEACKPFN